HSATSISDAMLSRIQSRMAQPCDIRRRPRSNQRLPNRKPFATSSQSPENEPKADALWISENETCNSISETWHNGWHWYDPYDTAQIPTPLSHPGPLKSTRHPRTPSGRKPAYDPGGHPPPNQDLQNHRLPR